MSPTAEIQYWIERRPPPCAQRWCQERDDSGAGLLKGTPQTADLRAALRRAGNGTWSARGGICVPERARLPESKAGREPHLLGGIRNSARSWNQKEPDYLTKGWEGILWAGRRNSALGAVDNWPDLHERPGGTKRTDWVNVDLPLVCRSGIDRHPSLFSERTREKRVRVFLQERLQFCRSFAKWKRQESLLPSQSARYRLWNWYWQARINSQWSKKLEYGQIALRSCGEAQFAWWIQMGQTKMIALSVLPQTQKANKTLREGTPPPPPPPFFAIPREHSCSTAWIATINSWTWKNGALHCYWL